MKIEERWYKIAYRFQKYPENKFCIPTIYKFVVIYLWNLLFP